MQHDTAFVWRQQGKLAEALALLTVVVRKTAVALVEDDEDVALTQHEMTVVL